MGQKFSKVFGESKFLKIKKYFSLGCSKTSAEATQKCRYIISQNQTKKRIKRMEQNLVQF